MVPQDSPKVKRKLPNERRHLRKILRQVSRSDNPFLRCCCCLHWHHTDAIKAGGLHQSEGEAPVPHFACGPCWDHGIDWAKRAAFSYITGEVLS